MGIYNTYFIYIMASCRNGTFYIGTTNDLMRRIYEHKNDFVEGFTGNYGLHTLVYYETFDSKESALIREKQLKKWDRARKIRLIKRANPGWRGMYDDLLL